MRIIVISDTHGNFRALESVLLRNSDADLFFHLGDGERDLDRFLQQYPQFTEKVIRVCGNCDYDSIHPDTAVYPLGSHRIFATHGHRYAVKNDYEIIKCAARENECDIVLFGHTHVRCNRIEGGLYLLNPGSASCPHDGNAPSFGHIDITTSGVVTNITEV